MSGPEPFTEGGSTPTSVEQWLTEIRLEEYADAFKAAGLTTLVKVSQMTDADLESAGVVKMGHRKKLMKHKALVSTHMARQKVSDSPAVMPAPARSAAVPLCTLEVSGDDTGRMAPQTVLRSNDPVPQLLTDLPLTKGARARVFKSVHAANAPCEDRHTVVHGKEFIFAGVWDGHTGPHCSQFAEDQVFLNLKKEVEKRTLEELGQEDGLRDPFERAYHDTDRAFLQEAKRRVREKEAKGSYLFAGTCAVGAYCDLATRKVSVSNLGDSRAVIGLYEPTGLRTVVMSHDQTANDSAEIRRLKIDFPQDETILVNKGGSNADESDWRVKGICQFTRSIGDFQMKERSIATVYNDYTRGSKVKPAPKTQRRADGTRAPPYVIPLPEFREQVRKRLSFLRHLYIKCIILPRQARDKHRESTQKRVAFSLSTWRTASCCWHATGCGTRWGTRRR
jgi:serine/threonine protein phosphatase PrpC